MLENQAYRSQERGSLLVANPKGLLAARLPVCSTGWQGQPFPSIPGHRIVQEWRSGAIFEKLAGFTRIPYDP